jgi:hypothetical protein
MAFDISFEFRHVRVPLLSVSCTRIHLMKRSLSVNLLVPCRKREKNHGKMSRYEGLKSNISQIFDEEE